MDTLFVNNSHLLTVQGLKNGEGEFVRDGATVEATLYEPDGQTEVTGASWPVVLTYVSGSNGDYVGDMPAGVEVEAGGRYQLRVTAEVSGRRFEVTRTVKAETRYG